MPNLTIGRTIDAPVDAVWTELAHNFADIHVWNPGVAASRSTSDQVEGEGITRHCDLKPFGAVEERVTGWHPGERLTVHIYESAKLPIKEGVADFTLKDLGDGKTEVTVDYGYELKWWGRLMPGKSFTRLLERGFGGLLSGLNKHVAASG
ncbi:MAG: SRPBCC family protein [Acidimicrobiia bacterium]|nr:SRPBCC family protein [Acidimicrobiia bacterium]